VQIKDSQVIIYNDQYPGGLVLSEPYLDKGTPTYSNSDDKISLGADEYFVLGDNRTASKDSRSFGAVNRSFITGRVFLRGWPFSRIAIFNQPVDYSDSK
jgi:signal peptidase I